MNDDEIDAFINTMQQFGGQISWRAGSDGMRKAYEINISLYDALQGTIRGPDRWNLERFVCAHAVMLGLEGIPAFYVHSLVVTHNDYERMENTGNNRAINRHQWTYTELKPELENPQSPHHQLMQRLKALIAIRRRQPAFHPNAIQFTLHLGEALFGYWRQSIFCIYNISDQEQTLSLPSINLTVTERWFDLISGRAVESQESSVNLAPYQALWISNHDGQPGS